MKKLFITLTIFLSLSFPLCSQSFNEPEFIGDAFLIKNNETVPVNKTLATFTAKANATMYIFGVGTIPNNRDGKAIVVSSFGVD